MAQSEIEIIKSILKGNLDAYRILVERYTDDIMTLCFRYLNNREEAEDAVQEVFIKAFQALPSWEPKAQFKTWLFRIGMNHCLNIIRRRQKVSFQPLEKSDRNESGHPEIDYPAPEVSPETQLINTQDTQRIQRLIGKLPENQRHVIILYYYMELSYLEIAEVLDTSLSSVESRIFRAKKSLAKLLGGKPEK